ncbi:hypothetical protein ACLOJK_007876 [Asimina triloba]
MDSDGPKANGCKINPKALEEAALKGDVGAGREGGDEEEEKESNSLLSPRNGGRVASSRVKKNPSRRKVQWNDRNGHKLVEILEYQPRFLSMPCLMMLLEMFIWQMHKEDKDENDYDGVSSIVHEGQ